VGYIQAISSVVSLPHTSTIPTPLDKKNESVILTLLDNNGLDLLALCSKHFETQKATTSKNLMEMTLMRTSKMKMKTTKMKKIRSGNMLYLAHH
jgi:ABC-type metal ion transport system substrate-binding protein